MIEIVLKIFLVLLLIIVIILFVFRIRRGGELSPLPENFKEILNEYVRFYKQLNEEGKEKFDKRIQQFLSSVQITGVNAEVEDLDRLLIAAGAIIPVYYYPDWQYINLHEVLLYPGTFNRDFDQEGHERSITGMVGTGAMQHVMIITKWQLRQGFINDNDSNNTAIHEFVHLVDKMDGTMDGVPEIILERKYVPQWKNMMESTIRQMKTSGSDINMYGATNPIEFFAVISEYFFKQPELLRINHPDLFEMLQRIFRTPE